MGEGLNLEGMRSFTFNCIYVFAVGIETREKKEEKRGGNHV